jgi:hypothetical protein
VLDTTLSPELAGARLGNLTASRMADATARTKTGWGASRANLMAALVCERLTGVPMQGHMNEAMRWGIEHEPEARYIPHPTIAHSGATPDGAVGEAGLIELKCPQSATHIDTLLTKSIDTKYIKQMQWQLACSEREWVDFSTFDPRMPEPLRLWTFRVVRDDDMISVLESDARQFLRELDEKVEALRKIGRMELAA